MSTQNATTQKFDASNANHETTRVGEMVVLHLGDSIHNVVNYEHDDGPRDHTYTVTDDGCSCPSAKYNPGSCKHEDAVSVAREQSESDDVETSRPVDERVSGPHTGYDKHGQADHTFWRCEDCDVEAIHRDALGEGCDC